jgi:[ribosomal protein S5]-alanine N-acetyltransferase
MDVDLETPRLMLRRPRLSDTSTLFEFLGDPAAMKHTQVDPSLRDCRRRIAAYERNRRRYGYAPWTVVRKEDRRIIGWGGLYNDPFDPGWGPEVGYFFHPDVWGRGLATELVGASIDVADRVVRLPRVWAFARVENMASRRVLEKVGFKYSRYVVEMERMLFCRTRPDA